MSDTKYGALTSEDLASVFGGCEDYVPPGLSADADPEPPTPRKKPPRAAARPAERAPTPTPPRKPAGGGSAESSSAYTKFLNNPGIDYDFFRFLR